MTHEYWSAFQYHLNNPSPIHGLQSEEEIIRLKNILGLTALDQTLCQFWQDFVLIEWDEVMSYCRSVQNNQELISELVHNSNGMLSKAQLMSSLRFLENTGEPERFSPSICDVVCWLWVQSPQLHTQQHAQYIKELLELQKIRNKVFHGSAGFNKNLGLRGLALLNAFIENASQLHPGFSNYMPQGTEILALFNQDKKQDKKAA